MRHFFLPTHQNANIPYSLSRRALISYSAALLVIKVISLLYLAFAPSYYATATDITAATIIDLTNTERVSAGLDTLAPNGTLTQAAVLRANYLLDTGSFSHEGCWTFFQQAGYDYWFAGENLAKDFSQAEAIVTAWMSSASHRANILKEQYTEIGVAVVPGLFNGEPTVMVVQLFGKPKEAATPPAETVLPPASEPPAESAVDESGDEPQTSEPPAEEPAPVPEPPADSAGESAVDTTAPTAPTLTFPLNNSYHTAITSVQGIAETGATVTLNDFDLELARGQAAGGVFTLSLSDDLAEGGHKLRARATDGAGNESSWSSPIDIIIDRKPPAVDATQTTAVVNLSNLTTYIQAVVTDEALESVTAKFGDNEVTLEPGLFAGAYRQTIDRALAQGTDLRLLVTDRAGNSLSYPVSLVTVAAAPTEPAPEDRTATPVGLTFMGQLSNNNALYLLIIGAVVLVFLLLKVVFRRGPLHLPTVAGALVVIALAGVLIFL